ncbi:MAG TPA: protein-glutamate O-methyltransferase CheR [Solirubrobacteraceae bacterium]|nr:protein-glutamate O-methyltransferase CheR [Solirubrobacteraceae bacterium]
MAVPISTSALPQSTDPEQIEVELLLEAIYRRYHYDFRGYARASLRRRLWRRAQQERVRTLSGLQERVLHDPMVMERLLRDLSINVTEMFRDPAFFRAVRERVVPILRTYPYARVWNAGCSTGEETFSLAIALAEEGLLDRVRMYATDMNEDVLGVARSGSFPMERMRRYTENYQRAGGTGDFSRYYTVQGDRAIFSRSLVEGAVFAQHNLAQDSSFNEFQLVMCRNVLIYFGRPLQERVHDLFLESLARFGVLALGHKESVVASHEDRYEVLDAAEKLYRRKR